VLSCLGLVWSGSLYVGKISTRIPKLISFGGFGIWWLYDVILIATVSSATLTICHYANGEVSPSPFMQNRLVGAPSSA